MCTTNNLLISFTARPMDNKWAMSNVVFLPYDATHFSTAVLVRLENVTENLETAFEIAKIFVFIVLSKVLPQGRNMVLSVLKSLETHIDLIE